MRRERKEMEDKREMGRKEGDKKGREKGGRGYNKENKGGTVSGEEMSQSLERGLCGEWPEREGLW